MPPGVHFPLLEGTCMGPSITTAASETAAGLARISLDDLHKRMQQTEGNASSIERQLNDVRAHLKTLREQVTLDGTAVLNLDLESIHPPVANSQDNREQQEHDKMAFEQVHKAFEAVEASLSKVKRKVESVQMELQISWMSFSSLQCQFKSKHHQNVQRLHEQLESKSSALEQLSGCYERMRHAFLDKDEEVKREKQQSINTLKALSVTHRDLDLKLLAINQEVSRVNSLSVQLHEWCTTTEAKADEQTMELKQLRKNLALIATSLLQLMDNTGFTTSTYEAVQQQEEERSSPPPPVAPQQKAGVDKVLPRMSERIDFLVQELKSERVEQDKVIESLWPSPLGEIEAPSEPLTVPDTVVLKATKEGSGKRKLSEAFEKGGSGCEEAEESKRLAEREREFLMQKKTFLSGLRESFQRLRQREIVCVTLERRLFKVGLLLDQAQRGCVSSDYVSMKCKRQMKQAYKEVLHVQRDIDSIKAMSNEQHAFDYSSSDDQLPACPPAHAQTQTQKSWDVATVMQSSDIERIKSELAKQIEINRKLKQQMGRLCWQAERAEGVVAVESFEVDKLKQQVQNISEKLKQEARRLNDSHIAAVRCRELTIQRLKEQLRVLQEEMNATVEKEEQLSMENEKLLGKLNGQDLDLLKLRNENVCLVVEKIAFEGSARALHEKMANLMSKLSQTKQNWKRFIVYCQTF